MVRNNKFAYNPEDDKIYGNKPEKQKSNPVLENDIKQQEWKK